VNRFNLTFKGEILPGRKAEQVKLRFGKMFGIDTPDRLERFFSGQSIILRRNLDRKTAAEVFQKLRELGVEVELVKVTTADTVAAIAKIPVRSAETEEAVREKAQREEAERRAAEEAARQQAELAEKKRREEEEAARQQALREEAERKAAEEAARLKAEEQRKKAEERARLKAQRAAEAARKKALKKKARRKARLQRKKKLREEARLKAELAEKKRKAAEESARPETILDEAKRKAAAEVARLQAEQKEVARKAAEEVAGIEAEQLQEEKAEQRRIATLKAAQEAAARQAVQEETRRKAAAQAASKAKKDGQRREQAEKAARSKAEEQRKREEQTAQRKAMEEQARQRAAAELAQQPALKPARASVKTNLELPQRSKRGTQTSTKTPRRRQSGEPNLYSLHPFRNTAEVRARAEQSRTRMRVGFIAAAVAGLLLLGGRFLSLPAAITLTGAGAMAIDAQARPLLLAGDSLLLHDRSGVGAGTLPLESLGLAALHAPMAFDTAGELLALGRLITAGAEKADAGSLQLLRCNLTESLCRPFSAELASSSIAGFAIHTLDGTIFLADAAKGQLLKASADGTILARATAAIPDNPVMRLESGLLFINSAQGPAVSVFRYDDSAFGQQLDEILLLPPAAIEAEQSRVGDFVWSADKWWASMYNPQTNSAGLYRFDTQWNFIGQAELPANTRPQQLATWRDKILVRDARHIPIQRFNAGGTPEAPLVSDLLESLVTRQQRNANLTGVTWRISLILCALVAVAGLCLGSLQRLRGLVYKPHREHGADPVDDYVDAVHWVDPITDRRGRLQRITISYAVIALALLLLAITRQVTPIQLTAALIALSGPAIALLLLGRRSVGHIGILQERLLLVDHSGMYHLGGGPRLQYCGPFLLLDDVVVFTGTRLLPAFSSKQIAGRVTPLAAAGIKVDRKTVVVKLLQGRHPLAQGAAAVLVAFTAAAVLLCLQGVF